MSEKFGRNEMIGVDLIKENNGEKKFAVESYLHHQGLKFADRFDEYSSKTYQST